MRLPRVLRRRRTLMLTVAWFVTKLILCFTFALYVGGATAIKASEQIVGADERKAFAIGFVPSLALALYPSFFI